ncbi:FAD/NAD-P-binding domain-containing protein, partial [Epithele typhae]|uniref:FAD/NAD-P-binding domain-containing protein n=1 Tax=Epithele typhae TaxID=378194 RepID=UPI002008E80A
GAGLGGLLMALVIQKDCPDVEVTIYESHAELTEVGAGIGVWPRVWEILKYVGLEDTLRQATGSTDPNEARMSMTMAKADEPSMIDFHQFAPTIYTFQRSMLQKLLAGHLRDPGNVLQFSKRLDTYTEPADGTTGPVILQFRDGTSASCDLLVGSDGIRSTVRRVMYTRLADAEAGEKAEVLRSMIEPVWSGWVAHRGLIPTAMLSQEALAKMNRPLIVSTSLVGKDKLIINYPIANGTLINVAAFVGKQVGEDAVYHGPWVAPETAEEVASNFEGWDPIVQNQLKCIQKPNLWAIHTTRVLPTYVRGQVALIGDAAHGMTTFQASGAGQAMEDGFILSAILSQKAVTAETLPGALRIYDEIRRPFSQDVKEKSRLNGGSSHLWRHGWENVTAEQSARGEYPRELLKVVGTESEQSMSWTIHGSIMQDRDTVLQMAGELGQ